MKTETERQETETGIGQRFDKSERVCLSPGGGGVWLAPLWGSDSMCIGGIH